MTTTAEKVQRDVQQELRWEPSIDAGKIGVPVKNVVVELDGHVGSWYQKGAAERATLRVANVRSIASEIVVDLSYTSERTDEDIAQAATDHVSWNILVLETVKVNGWVTLLGTAEWQYQREEAERVVRPLLGVKAVKNEIKLKPKLNATDVKAKIEEVLKRDAQIESNKITVEASISVVTLTGTVYSWRERQDAEHPAFNAPGVTAVTNLIELACRDQLNFENAAIFWT